MGPPILLIGGTTASGKSALALRLAEAAGAWIVNADAQQLYRHLPRLTAQPSAADLRTVPHRLYGILPPETATSVALWLDRLEPVLKEARAHGTPLILVGGTGLYLKALLHGLAPVPPIPAAVRERLRGLPLPAPELHRLLAAKDPIMAARLHPTDRQRILRALEVVEATGRSLASFQQEPHRRLPLAGPVRGIALLPDRSLLHARIQARLERMLEEGVIEEVAALWRLRPDLRDLPVARVHGLLPLLDRLEGRISLEQAKERILIQTRQYAKRQSTFFRHKLPELRPVRAFGDEPPPSLVDSLLRALGR